MYETRHKVRSKVYSRQLPVCCVITPAARSPENILSPSPRARPHVASIDAGTVKEYAVLFGALLSAIVFGTYWVPKLIVSLLPTQNLKKKYDAEWALVTGSSSGIGKSIAFALAKQGVNVVLVALQEPLLDETFEELKASFGDRKFLKIGVNLGAPGYVDKIADATKDIDVQLVFNNAGHMLTGFFDKTPLARLMMNHECNATSAIQITHVFVRGAVFREEQRGCVEMFRTSSARRAPAHAVLRAAAPRGALRRQTRRASANSPRTAWPRAHARPRRAAADSATSHIAVRTVMLLKVFDYGFFAALISGAARTPCPTTMNF